MSTLIDTAKKHYSEVIKNSKIAYPDIPEDELIFHYVLLPAQIESLPTLMLADAINGIKEFLEIAFQK